MSISIADLQELPQTEEVALQQANCCQNTLISGCQLYSVGISTCHSCTNTN